LLFGLSHIPLPLISTLFPYTTLFRSYMWETTFAFRTQSSAQELRRYMHQMIYEFTQIEHLVGVNRTRYNQYESIMLPLIKYLEGQGCNFVMNRRVTDFEFKDTPMQDEITVTGLEMENIEQ